MHRFTAPALAIAFLVVQICCAPPLRAAAIEGAEPMQCPIQKQECETKEARECGSAPELISEAPIKKLISAVQLHALALVIGERLHVEAAFIAGGPIRTRTIPLRI